jgi:hypothetical protein
MVIVIIIHRNVTVHHLNIRPAIVNMVIALLSIRSGILHNRNSIRVVASGREAGGLDSRFRGNDGQCGMSGYAYGSPDLHGFCTTPGVDCFQTAG